MAFKYTRREAVKGIGAGAIVSMLPGWIYKTDNLQLPNKIVTYLNPETILINHGVSARMDKADFNSAENWSLSYRLWEAIGAGQDDNKGASSLGYLIIEKTNDNAGPGQVKLKVREKILQQGSRPAFKDNFQYTEAQILCSDNDIATPLDWEIKHSVWRANTRLDYCSLTEKGEIKILSNEVIVRLNINNTPRPELRFKRGTGISSDLTLFAALPKLLVETSGKFQKKFILLEKLRLQKEHQILSRSSDSDYISDNFGNLHKFEHRGNGILPFDYWLDDDGRPLFICTLHNAYIYDLKAEEKVEEICATGKRRQFED